MNDWMNENLPSLQSSCITAQSENHPLTFPERWIHQNRGSNQLLSVGHTSPTRSLFLSHSCFHPSQQTACRDPPDHPWLFRKHLGDMTLSKPQGPLEICMGKKLRKGSWIHHLKTYRQGDGKQSWLLARDPLRQLLMFTTLLHTRYFILFLPM